MVKKGKYKLLSYIINDSLIFYKSLNKKQRFVAFNILEAENFHQLISILNKFLNKRYLNYYSIQIDNLKKKKLFILNFEDEKKDRIIKIFNLLYQELIKKKADFICLKNEELERSFLQIIINDSNHKINLITSRNSMELKIGDLSTFIELYHINFQYLEKKSSFIHNLLDFITDLNKRGYLIFNFKVDNYDQLIISSFFIEIRKNFKNFKNIEIDVNNFYNCNVLKKENLILSKIYRLLWRSELFNKSILYNEVIEIFSSKNSHDFNDFSKINNFLEKFLFDNQISFKRFNANLLFIDQKILFFIFKKLNSRYIQNILKKYSKKYFIYILILDEIDIGKLLEIEGINLLNNVKFISPDELASLNFELIKNKEISKDT